ncbi:unnamed protein product [marine sediment metagenome]|uniref:Uncharacterized protein n=1 Tax=marine sediment metagenome TaxID=412755 RepID=X1TGB8_9ZZZZ
MTLTGHFRLLPQSSPKVANVRVSGGSRGRTRTYDQAVNSRPFGEIGVIVFSLIIGDYL